MKLKYEIKLSNLEREYAQNIVSDKSTSETFKKRAQIILARDAAVGKPEPQTRIAVRVGVSQSTVWACIKQFFEEGLESTLRFKTPSEPNKKPVVNGEIEARIVARACAAPPEGYGRWTVRLLTDKVALEVASGYQP